MKKLLFLSISLLLAASPLMADLGSDIGTVGDSGFPASFLYSLGGAKALSAGYAWTVLGDDATSVFFNPATLLKLDGSAVSLSFNALPQDRMQAAAVVALYSGSGESYESYLKTPKVFAISAVYQTVGSVPGFDAGGGSLASPGNYSMMGQLSYASAFSRDARVGGFGLGLRVLMEDYDGSSTFGLGINAGAEVSVLNFIRLGASLNNLGILRSDTVGTLWLRPLLSLAAKLNLPMLPIGLVLQGDKVLGDGRKLSDFIMRTAIDFNIFSIKPDPVLMALDTGMSGGLPAYEDKKRFELVARIGLVDANDLYGGLSIRWNFIELSYGVGQDAIGKLRHSVSLDLHL